MARIENMLYHQGEIRAKSYNWYANAQHFIKKWGNKWSNGGINCLCMLKRRQLTEPLFILQSEHLIFKGRHRLVIQGVPKNASEGDV